MQAFLQTYGSWIVFGVLVLLMFRMHCVHGAHGGHHVHSAHSGYDDYDRDPSDTRQDTEHGHAPAEEAADQGSLLDKPALGSFASTAPRTMSAVQPPARELSQDEAEGVGHAGHQRHRC